MAIRQISLSNFRNLKPVRLNFDSRFNLIQGTNASGKTSLLEAISFLCEGRSFRTHLADTCIQHSQKDFLLFAQFDHYKVGFSRSEHGTTIRLDDETIRSLSKLARMTPVRVIDSQIYQLICGSPQQKRIFMDWLLFHVEHQFHDIWSRHRHILKQRNALLKQKNDLAQLDHWDDLLTEYADKIHQLRKKWIGRIQNQIQHYLNTSLHDMNIQIDYKPGWKIDQGLKQELKQKRSKDIRYGFTSVGSHRDDLRITSSGLPAHQILSRGQIKRLCVYLYLAQIRIVDEYRSTTTILLIDDLMSELDLDAVDELMIELARLNSQVFITMINTPPSISTLLEEYRLFHMEHGMINPVNR